jgi:hypothetical protein
MPSAGKVKARSSKTGGRVQRDRSQLVIALGDGNPGAERWLALRAAADAEGVTLSEWARERLLAAAGLPPVSPLAARLPELERRVAELGKLTTELRVLRQRVDELEAAERNSSVWKRLDAVERELGIPGP